MSKANLDRFIETAEAFNRMTETAEAFDLNDLQAFLGTMDPKIQFQPQQATLQGGYLGHEGVTKWLADLPEHYSGGHMDLPDVRDLEDRVLALGTLRFIGRGSGIEVEVPVAVVANFRDGLITHFKDYGDKDQALAAIGLTE
jgi:ketosteroid isomerase-like protein